MNVFTWLFGQFSNRGKAVLLYKRGMAKAKSHDHQGAIEDYSKTNEMPHAPADLKAAVLYNRALVYMANGEDQKGADDLATVMAMVEAPTHIKTMVKQKMARMESRTTKSNS